jgi:hypothetical protein
MLRQTQACLYNFFVIFARVVIRGLNDRLCNVEVYTGGEGGEGEKGVFDFFQRTNKTMPSP